MPPLTDLKRITYVHPDYEAAFGENVIGYFKYQLAAEEALNAHALGLIMSGAIPPEDDPPLPNPLPDDADPPTVCEKCSRVRKTLTRYTYGWWCGTCISRYERQQNTREMYGHGRRGY